MDGQAWALIIGAVFVGLTGLITGVVSAILSIMTFVRQSHLSDVVAPVVSSLPVMAENIKKIETQGNSIQTALQLATAQLNLAQGRSQEAEAALTGGTRVGTPAAGLILPKALPNPTPNTPGPAPAQTDPPAPATPTPGGTPP